MTAKKPMTAKHYLVLPLAGLALIVAGCGSSSSSSGNSTTNSKPAAQAEPTESHAAPMMSVDTGAKLTVSSPHPNAVVRSNSVGFDLGISHFKVACQYAGTPNRKGIGHYHVELDGALINMFCAHRGQVRAYPDRDRTPGYGPGRGADSAPSRIPHGAAMRNPRRDRPAWS